MSANRLKMVEFQKGDYLFQEGEESFHFFIIQDGEVEIFKSDEEGNKIYLAKANAGNSIGEFAHIDRQARSASVQALTPVRAIMVSEQSYKELLDELPTWAVSMIEGLVDRLRQTNDMVRKLYHNDSETHAKLDSLIEFDTGVSVIDATNPSFVMENPDNKKS